jgi:hypothetical protein
VKLSLVVVKPGKLKEEKLLRRIYMQWACCELKAGGSIKGEIDRI